LYKNGKKPMRTRQSKNCLLLVLAVLVAASGAAYAQEWKLTRIPAHETVTGLSFTSPNDGWLVTSGAKVAQTHDAGKTWAIFTLQKGDPTFEDVCFFKPDSGMICGRNGVIYRTPDGGKGWKPSAVGDTISWFTSIVMVSSQVAVVVGLVPDGKLTGVAYRTVNGGLSWRKIPDMGFGYGELFYRKGEPLCFQSWGKLHYSLDSGKTWSTLNTASGKTGRTISFFNQTGVICGNESMIARSSDRGRSWTPLTATYDADLTGVALVNDSTGYICGTGGTVLKTIDGGKRWVKENVIPEAPVDFSCMQLVGNTLFIGGADGMIASKKVR
jgi:photosystem II stability/assembly factor-like uncharacterized protein